MPSEEAVKPRQLRDEDVVRLTALGMTTLEVTHDLGNLLQVAGSAVRVIERHVKQAPQTTLLPIVDAAISSIERAMMLCHRILKTARPRTPVNEAVDADALLQDMHDALACAIGPGINLMVHTSSGVPGVKCHRADLENVILNLAINARDAMGGVGTLTMRVGRAPSVRPSTARENVFISVADTGCGMSDDVAARIFEPFFTTKSDHHGTGLGLAMVAAFIGRLGGTVNAVSVVGKGTTFTLQFPCADTCPSASASFDDREPDGGNHVDQ